MILHFYNDRTEFADVPIWIARVKLGAVVQGTDFDGYGSKVLANRYGHIVGFARNPQNELILQVRWDDGETLTVHPANVKMLDV